MPTLSGVFQTIEIGSSYSKRPKPPPNTSLNALRFRPNLRIRDTAFVRPHHKKYSDCRSYYRPIQSWGRRLSHTLIIPPNVKLLRHHATSSSVPNSSHNRFRRPNVQLQNWAGRAKHGEREIQAGKVANALIGIGAIFIAITRMMKGLVMNF
jgi:hypothetical protein